MNSHDNPNKSSTLLLVGMLAVIALGVVGALVYNQQLHVYENRAKERGTIQQQQVKMENGAGEANMQNDDKDALPQDPNDSTVVTNGMMPTTEMPNDFKLNSSGNVRTDL